MRDHWEYVTGRSNRMLSIGNENAGRVPIGQKRLSPQEQDRRSEGLVAAAAHGLVPVTEDLAPIIGRHLERTYGKVVK